MKLRSYNLDRKIAVITGAAGLLGPRHAFALLEAGATVALTDVNVEALRIQGEKLVAEFGRERVVLISMDVTLPQSISSCLRQLISTFQRVDILINNAAIDPKVTDDTIGGAGRFESFQLKQWNQEVAVGLTGAFLCSQIFGTWMAEHGGGCILNISSDLSVIAPDQRLYEVSGVEESMQKAKPVTYSVIKTGLIGLTRYLAAYWATKKVRVNALSPAGVYTNQPAQFVEKLLDRIPMHRMATPDEYCGAIQFLCSDASKYMTGQNIVIDGGRSIL